MDRNSVIKIIGNVWQNLVSHERLLIVEIAQNVLVSVIEEELIDSGLVDAFRAQLVYEFCERRMVSSAFEMPLRRTSEGIGLWIEDLMFIFARETDGVGILCQEKPEIVHPVMISIGGPSGAGKTTVVRRMRSRLGDVMMVHPAFTTRPKRNDEAEGVDYYFVNAVSLEQARQDRRYTGFVEARGNWYWINPSGLLKSLWSNPDKIHVFLNSQRHEFEYRKKMFPKLRWVWLDADLPDLEVRLRARGDDNVEESMAHNRNLRRQQIDDLVDLKIATQTSNLNAVVEEVITYCNLLATERSMT